RRDIWFGLCEIQRERRDTAGLVACSEEALKRFPDDPDLVGDLFENARPLIQRAEFADAAASLEPLARQAPKSRDLVLAYGRALYLSGRRADGVDALRKLSELYPEDGEIHYQRGELAAFDGDFAQAGISFARASRLKARGGLGHLGVVSSMHVLNP